MSEPTDWYVDLGDGVPDSTTEAIIEVDRKIHVAEKVNEEIIRVVTCEVCGEPGIHTHWMKG